MAVDKKDRQKSECHRITNKERQKKGGRKKKLKYMYLGIDNQGK